MLQSTIEGHAGNSLVVRRWADVERANCVIQIAHGAGEHLGRYDRLARFLNDRRYAVIGADHRGHGANAEPYGCGDLGPHGFTGLVEDMRMVTQTARAEFTGKPVILLGHSFGSFASQLYLMKYADLIDGLILSGTAALDLLLSGADLASGMTAANASFEPARTPFDWLSRDEAEVDAYIADPLCGFDVKPQSLATMVQAAADFGERHDLSIAAAKDLPVYVISGEYDPIVGPEQILSRALVDDYIRAGLRDVQHRVYPGGRHEMFNEIDRDEVMRDLADWLDARFPRLRPQ